MPMASATRCESSGFLTLRILSPNSMFWRTVM